MTTKVRWMLVPLVLVGGLVASAVDASMASAAPTTTSRTFPTNVAGVRVWTQPSRHHGSRVVKVLSAKGTTVTVSCYVTSERVSRDRIWYRVTSPATGYVPGFDLRSGHDPASGVARCAGAVTG